MTLLASLLCSGPVGQSRGDSPLFEDDRLGHGGTDGQCGKVRCHLSLTQKPFPHAHSPSPCSGSFEAQRSQSNHKGGGPCSLKPGVGMRRIFERTYFPVFSEFSASLVSPPGRTNGW